jgi:hypothetical protein
MWTLIAPQLPRELMCTRTRVPGAGRRVWVVAHDAWPTKRWLCAACSRGCTPLNPPPSATSPLVVQKPSLGALRETPPVPLKRGRHAVAPEVRLRRPRLGRRCGGPTALRPLADALGCCALRLEPLRFQAPAHEFEPRPYGARRAALLVAGAQVPHAAAGGHVHSASTAGGRRKQA